MTKRNSRRAINRRQLLRGMAACAAGSALGLPRLLDVPKAFAQPQSDKKPRFLVVIGGFGGASIVDSCLAIRENETANPRTINAFPNAEVKDIAGSPFRAVDLARPGIGDIGIPFVAVQSDFVNKHKDDMMVVTQTGTSVNHAIAQKRSLTGNGAFYGRTLQEAVALEYGEGFPIPNVNMATMGYLEHGDDPSLPSYCYNEPVAAPDLWPLSLHGSRGIKDAPSQNLIDRARAVRDDKLDPESGFYATFRRSGKLERWRRQRDEMTDLEAVDLISRLSVSNDEALAEYGLTASPDTPMLRSVFDQLDDDPLEAQAALAFLLIKNRVSVAVTIAPTFNIVVTPSGIPNPPLAFDFSHSDHRATQAVMWKRVYGIADRLIDLLKAEEFDPATGESLWDRTLIYVATDFGRSRNRVNGEDSFSSSHHLNNGNVIISPMVNGNTVLGGVDTDTGLTYGFDPVTGVPDPNREMTEAEIYAGVAHALGVSTSGTGLPDMPAMRRNG